MRDSKDTDFLLSITFYGIKRLSPVVVQCFSLRWYVSFPNVAWEFGIFFLDSALFGGPKLKNPGTRKGPEIEKLTKSQVTF